MSQENFNPLPCWIKNDFLPIVSYPAKYKSDLPKTKQGKPVHLCSLTSLCMYAVGWPASKSHICIPKIGNGLLREWKMGKSI